MANTYTVKVNNSVKKVKNFHIDNVGQAQGKGLHLVAQAGDKFQLVDNKTGFAPNKILAKRAGKDLHVAFEQGDIADPDLVIENYYSVDQVHLLGQTDSGRFADYVFDRPDASTTVLATGSEVSPAWYEPAIDGLDPAVFSASGGTAAGVAAGSILGAVAGAGVIAAIADDSDGPGLHAAPVTQSIAEGGTIANLHATVLAKAQGATDIQSVDTTGTKGTVTFNAATDTLVYTADAAAQNALAAGETATDTFTYTVTDGKGGAQTETVTVTINGVNDVPVGADDTATIAANAAGTINGTVLTNDTDVDNGAALIVSAVTGGTVGQVLAGTYGSITINADGTYSYDVDQTNPALIALAAGASVTDTFTYTVSDGLGGTDTATVTVTINGVNDAPVATDDTATVAANAAGTISGTVLTNDTDLDNGAALTALAVTGGTVGQVLAGTYGSITINADGTYSYDVDQTNPALIALAAGASVTDTFTYTVSDGLGGTDTATVTVTINGVNDAPVATDDTATVAANAAGNISGNVINASDSDVDNDAVLYVSGVEGHTVGAAFAGTYGTFTINADGSYTYNLNEANAAVKALNTTEHLTDTITYTVSDEHGATDTATITVTINGVNEAPVASDDKASIASSSIGTISGNVLGSTAYSAPTIAVNTYIDALLEASEDGEDKADVFQVTLEAGKTYTLVMQGSTSAHGTMGDPYLYLYNAAGQRIASDDDSADDHGSGGNRDAYLAFTPVETGTYYIGAATYNAQTGVTYRLSISDGGPLTDATATVIAEETGIKVGTNLTFGSTTGDTDVDHGAILHVSAVDGHTVGTAFTGTYGTFTINADGSYTYDLDEGNTAVRALTPTQRLTDTITYTVSDEHGATDTATLTVTINGTVPTLRAVPVAQSVNEDAATGNLHATLLANSTLATDVQSVDTTGTVGTVAFNGATNTMIYTADAAAQDALAVGETATDTFTYTVTDGNGHTSTATVTMTVNGVNDAPVAGNDTNTVAANASAAITGNVIGTAGFSAPVLAMNTEVAAAIEADDSDGNDVFAVTLEAGKTYTITMKGKAEAGLTLDNSRFEIYDDAGICVDYALSMSGNPAVLNFIPSTSGTYYIAPSDYGWWADLPRTDESYRLSITDGTAAVTPAAAGAEEAGMTVQPDESGEGYPTLVFGSTGADTDVDNGAVLQVSAVAGHNVGETFTSTYGSFIVNADGSYSYEVNTSNADLIALASGQTRQDSLTYIVSDEHGATDTATLTVTITGINDGPTAVDDAASMSFGGGEAALQTGNVLSNDTDPDTGDSLAVYDVNGFLNRVGQPVASTYGTFTINADGSYTYDLDEGNAALVDGASLTDVIGYRVMDQHGSTDVATLAITINVIY